MIGTVPILTINAMLEGMRLLGLDAERIAVRSGVQSDDRLSSQERVADAVYATLWREARIASGLDDIGAAVGVVLPTGAFGVVDYLASSAPTLGQSIASTRDFSFLTAESSYWEIEHGPNDESVVRFVNRVAGEEDVVGDEFALGIILGRLSRWALGPVRPCEVQLTRRKPSRGVTKRLGGHVSYGHQRSQLIFGPSVADMPLRQADPRLHTTLLMLLQETGTRPTLPSFASSAITLVRGCVRELLSQGTAPTLNVVGKTLGVSGRTLQRKLKAEGCRFEDAVDDVRRQSALIRLRADDGLSILELALSLGFSDDRAFARAFRRWTGVSPRQWRAAPSAY
jgi:AraC-like DNA-binding protein